MPVLPQTPRILQNRKNTPPRLPLSLPGLQVLAGEQDVSTKRNAFQMLCQHAQPLAVKYLLSQVDSVALWGDILQIAALDLIAKVCWGQPLGT